MKLCLQIFVFVLVIHGAVMKKPKPAKGLRLKDAPVSSPLLLVIPVNSSWNDYLGTYSPIFPKNLDTIHSNLTDYAGLKKELLEILNVPQKLQLIHANYREDMEKDSVDKRPANAVDRTGLFKIFLLEVLKGNVEFHTGKRSWQSGVTTFADWTEEEKHIVGADG